MVIVEFDPVLFPAKGAVLLLLVVLVFESIVVWFFRESFVLTVMFVVVELAIDYEEFDPSDELKLVMLSVLLLIDEPFRAEEFVELTESVIFTLSVILVGFVILDPVELVAVLLLVGFVVFKTV